MGCVEDPSHGLHQIHATILNYSDEGIRSMVFVMSKYTKISIACVLLFGGCLGIHLIAREVSRGIPTTPQNVLDFSNPLIIARVGLNVLSHLYPTAAFWTLTWLSRIHAENPVFSEARAGKMILSFGGALIVFAQGPAFFVSGWLQGDQAPLYHTFYGIGWCFLLVGMFRWPAVRHILLGGRPGTTALVISLVWYMAGSLRHEFAWNSIGWSLAAILSVFVALCGVLSHKRSERNLAACGLILMSVYSFYGGRFGGMAWLQISLLFDPRVMEPFQLTSLLAWTAVALQATGLSRRWGIEYGK
jgi:hypothetical protein